MVLGLSALAATAFADDMKFQNIASDVYVAIAPNETASPANRGFVSNLGFIVGRSGVIAVGTGASERQGEAMISAIRAVTRKPIALAINLQATPDHVLGNRPFVRRKIPILAHRETDRFMKFNCRTCIRNARKAVGARRMGAATLAEPNRLIDDTRSIEVGGRVLDVVYYGATFQPGSVTVLDRQSRTLFAGDMVSLNRVPDLRNADIAKWRAALQDIAGSSASLLVPGHGPVCKPVRAAELARYLTDLRSEVETAYDRGVPMQDAVQAAPLSAYSAWVLYEALHPSNVHFTYLKVETEDLAR
jgi:glyoxylase-like metal-dependent hydrolase (beta-lactamase superfamily II)